MDLFIFSPEAHLLFLRDIEMRGVIAAIIFNVALLLVLAGVNRAGSAKILAAICAAALTWQSWRFQIIEYISVDPNAYWPGALGLIVASVLMILTYRMDRHRCVDDIAVAALTVGFVVIMYPFIVWLTVGQWHVSPVGVLPAPTLLLVLGILLSVRIPLRALLSFVCVVLIIYDCVILYLHDHPLWQVGVTIMILLLTLKSSIRYANRRHVS